MNGMVVNSWPYVVASYAVTWVVLIGYSARLYFMLRRDRASGPSSGSNR